MICPFCNNNACDCCGACENCRKFYHESFIKLKDEQGKEIVAKVKAEGTIQKKDLVEILDHMVTRLDNLPNHAKNEFITVRELSSFMSLISSIFKELN